MWGGLVRKAADAMASAFGERAGREEGEPEAAGPPADATDEAVEAWVLEHLDIADWVYLGRTPGGVTLAGRTPADREFRIPMRLELFQAAKDRRGRFFRSMVVSLDVESAADRFRLNATSTFRRNNLQDLIDEAPGDPGGWASLAREPGPFFDHLRGLCAQASGQGGAEGPASRLAADVRAWVEATVQQGPDIYAYADEVGATYVQAGSVSRTAKGYALTVRIEFFRPFEDVRSQTVPVELDLGRRRMRQVEVRRFSGHNLKGEATPAQRLGGWIDTGSTLTPEQFDRLSDIAKVEARD